MKIFSLIILLFAFIGISLNAQDLKNKTIDQLTEMKKDAVANENYEQFKAIILEELEKYKNSCN